MTASRRVIDVNCDMGESFGNWKLGHDEDVIREITTANVACGFHGGDPITMLKTAALAKEHGVVVGAHPGLPDLLGFGRRAMAITPEDAYAYVTYQVGALEAVLRAIGTELHHVKPHGAMYVMLNQEEALAAAVVDAVLEAMESPMIYWPAPLDASAFARNARSRGVRVVGEMYPDLEYASDGSLILQRSKQPVDLRKTSTQVRRFVDDARVETRNGSLVPIEAESICVHGDGPNVVDLLQAIRAVLHESACTVTAVTSGADPTLVASR